MVDHLKDYQKLEKHFQGIDDLVGGRFLPTLPIGSSGVSADQK
jgi:hypothetical protein